MEVLGYSGTRALFAKGRASISGILHGADEFGTGWPVVFSSEGVNVAI
jgi:hypothetical protein